ALEPAVPRRDRTGVHVVAVVRGEPYEIGPRVEGIDDLGAAAGQEVCAPGGVAGDRRVGQEREVVFAAGRIQAATALAVVLRDRFPRVTGVLDDVDDRRVIEVRGVLVAGDAEGAPSDQGDVVRLGRVRDALPMLGEPVLVR